MDGSKIRQSRTGGWRKPKKTEQKSQNEGRGELSHKAKIEENMRKCLEVSDMETRLLECEILLGQLKKNTKTTPEKKAESKNGEDKPKEIVEQKENKNNKITKVQKVIIEGITMSNELPDRDVVKLNSKFATQEINLAIMNPGGMKGKADSMRNAMHTHDIRICVVSETHCVGKEIPKLNPQTKAFHNNRTNKRNKGGVCILVENSIAKDCVVIGMSDNNKDKDKSNKEWIAIKINSFETPVVIIGTYGCQASKNTVEESLIRLNDILATQKPPEDQNLATGQEIPSSASGDGLSSATSKLPASNYPKCGSIPPCCKSAAGSSLEEHPRPAISPDGAGESPEQSHIVTGPTSGHCGLCRDPKTIRSAKTNDEPIRGRDEDNDGRMMTDDDDECAMIKGNENAKRNNDIVDDAMVFIMKTVILQCMNNSDMKANEGISYKEKDDGRSGSSACQKFKGNCENLNKSLFKEELSREAGISSDVSQVLLKPKHFAMIRQNLLGLQRGLDRALRIRGNDEMSEDDNVFKETTLFNFYLYTLI